jgi:SRSO17 transposase
VELIQELQHWGFRFAVVLVDSLHGESDDFISELEKLYLKYLVAREIPRAAQFLEWSDSDQQTSVEPEPLSHSS